VTDWAFLLILNISIPGFDSISPGVRVFACLVQAVSVRLTGYNVITLSAIAPVLKCVHLYPVCCFLFTDTQRLISCYDVYRSISYCHEVCSFSSRTLATFFLPAGSIHATNIFEECFLSIFEEENEDANMENIENDADDSDTDFRAAI
jgi:hypothetical protein